jgi:hypothetical protein
MRVEKHAGALDAHFSRLATWAPRGVEPAVLATPPSRRW